VAPAARVVVVVVGAAVDVVAGIDDVEVEVDD
jgi:hypothetical protein